MTDKLLEAALDEIKATPLQRKMAAILLAVNGLESARGFVEMRRGEKRLVEATND